jgi:hypothetical protein
MLSVAKIWAKLCVQAEHVLLCWLASHLFWTELLAGSNRVSLRGSPAVSVSSWLGLGSSSSSFFQARPKPDRVGSRPGLVVGVCRHAVGGEVPSCVSARMEAFDPPAPSEQVLGCQQMPGLNVSLNHEAVLVLPRAEDE